MKKTAKSMLLLLPLVAGMLVGCQNTDTPSSGSSGGDTPASSQAPTSGETPTSGVTPGSSQTPASSTPVTGVTLNMAVAYKPKDGSTSMKFNSGAGALSGRDSYTAADGNTYRDGDFKPVWAALQQNLEFSINDVTGNSDSDVEDLYTTVSAANFTAGTNSDPVHVLVGNGDQIVEDGTAGNIVDLAAHLDEMPNFSKFLSDNPAVKQIIMADPANNKGIYYAPYFDGYDDIERMLLLRKDWVVDLLDGDYVAADYRSDLSLTSSYTTYNGDSVNCEISVVDAETKEVVKVKKNHTKSIITIQNELTTKNGTNLVKALRDYIDTTFDNHYGTERSRLFVGSEAAYDVDELVALYRCVRYAMEDRTVTWSTTASSVKTEHEQAFPVVPLFPRESGANRYADFWRFMQFFGVRGAESRNGFLYVGDDGKLHDMRADTVTMNAVTKMNEMYAEGLILTGFGDKTATYGGNGKYNADLLQADLGFSSYDYCQTQTIYNDNAKCKVLNGGRFEYVPTMPAVYDWEGTGTQYHYTESWRSVKSNGWCIPSHTTGDQLAKALELFDYLYSSEGNTLMSYGPSAWIDGTIEYQGKQVPKLSSKALAELTSLASGNYTNYYRYFVGGTFPIGYVKEQGMEYQCTSAKAQVYLGEINNCIAKGTLKHVNHNIDNTDVMLDIIPATLAYNTEEATAVANFKEMGVIFSTSSGGDNIWRHIIQKGWDHADVAEYGDEGRDMSKASYQETVKETLQVDAYLTYANDAYARMGMRTATSAE